MDKSIQRLQHAMDYAAALKRSNLKFGDIHNAEQDVRYLASEARGRVLRHAMDLLEPIHPPVTRPIETRAQFIASAILSCPIRAFSGLEMTAYLRHTRAPMGLLGSPIRAISQSEVDEVLASLYHRHLLTVRAGNWLRIAQEA